MTPGARPQKKRLLWALSCLVVLILSGAVAFWAVRHGDRPVASDDCAVVEQLGQQWNAMAATINAQENGAGGQSDLTAIADTRSAMSQKISDAADHESSPTLRDLLRKWAEGSALAAKVQRNSASDSPETTARADEDFSRAAVEVYQATSALRQACPKCPGTRPPTRACSVARAKVQDVTPHDLRHTCASLAISAGVNVLALQRMLGHTSVEVTLDTYADLFDDDLDAVVVTVHSRYSPDSVAKTWPITGVDTRR